MFFSSSWVSGVQMSWREHWGVRWLNRKYRKYKPNRSKCLNCSVAVCKRLSSEKMPTLLFGPEWNLVINWASRLNLALRELWRKGSSTSQTWSWKEDCGRKGKEGQSRNTLHQLVEAMTEKTAPIPGYRLSSSFWEKSMNLGRLPILETAKSSNTCSRWFHSLDLC